ncbi:BZ3500_MvSof-1268-A1-R1_Chr10-2g02969 [Microbotryum saponariae]|uniref:BZ3500_MvSof-1268-A1-R1_Chr10-2g02969 protein n=1 Tax=Microbotryum saponariae TaxID=289078 RepID=A0A2X0N423_9BASI|nr:BZ3501_MvSof-1269-A2-R1_Chr10-2g02555 [Microbotryum saponariae]SDA01842.1 BZ3500_MvSof-1268-A1-R1_Chr10-2g02969 [Microbotryum saponariae]
MPYYQDDATAGNVIDSILDVLEPYLPSSLLRPLHQLLTLPWTSLLSSPTSLLSLLLSLFAIYTAFLSMYNTTRFAFRLSWFLAKWSTLIGAIAVGWNAYTNGWSGTTQSLDKMQGFAKTTWGVGKTGAQWWFGQGQSGSTSRSGSGSGSSKRSSASRVGKNKRKSASGRTRTWATTTDEGGWDDPAEVDLGEEYGVPRRGADERGENAWNTARDTLFAFMGSANDAPSASKDKKKRSTKPKAKTRTQASPPSNDIPGGWAMKFAMNQAKKMWDDATGGGSAASSSGKDNRKRNR